MSERGGSGARDFYVDVVLPALAERLDSAFPEFGWRRDAYGWVATNEETTHRRLGVRASRVVAHGPAPRGFLVHGGEPTLWTAYVSGGGVPRGVEFVRAVEEIARRAGLDPSPISRPVRRDRRTDLLHDFFAACSRELASENGRAARAYLTRRGLPASTVGRAGLGVIPTTARSHHALRTAGFSDSEIASSNVLADPRWPGRLCGAWGDETGRVRTLWARALDPHPSRDPRYLYLRGTSRADLPPYGLARVPKPPPGAGRELVLVEGLFDVHQLWAHGIENVAALGGTAARSKLFERLTRLGFERVTLCLDRDESGRRATARAVEQAARAASSPAVSVIDPRHLAPAKDPDEFIRRAGPDAWHELVAKRTCGIGWRARELAGDTDARSPADDRRGALARAGGWLGTLPPRLALETEDAVSALAELCGYSRDAVARSFRARFWLEAALDRPPSRATTIDQARGL